LFKEKNYTRLKMNMLHVHNDVPQCVCFDKEVFKHDWQNLSFVRALLVAFTTLGWLFVAYSGIKTANWGFENVTMLLILAMLLYIVVTVPEHFLNDHLWKHTIKKHLPRIFLWTFGALLVIDILLPYFNISQTAFAPIAEKYYFLILTIAVLVGIIPESGPNLVFVFLFSQGYVPLSILIANSIVQDGHGSLPLLAESRKSFFITKFINIIVGFIVGAVGFLFL
jgi:hypothetical protein